MKPKIVKTPQGIYVYIVYTSETTGNHVAKVDGSYQVLDAEYFDLCGQYFNNLKQAIKAAND